MNEQLLIIDPQFDFCDPTGALYVQNAEHDMARLAKFIKNYGENLSDIHVTLDTHHLFDVAHPIFWKDSQGNNPDPGTIISYSDVQNSKWVPSVTSLTTRMLQYVKSLEEQDKYPLMIWPPHCLIGSDGHKVMPDLMEALLEWEASPAMVKYITKGTNPYTEHYSAVKAEVVDPDDPDTQINASLIEINNTADILWVAGEAGSHCLAYTLRDLIETIGSQEFVKKVRLLTDCMSPVIIPGVIDFTSEQEKLIAEVEAKGAKAVKSTDVISATVFKDSLTKLIR